MHMAIDVRAEVLIIAHFDFLCVSLEEVLSILCLQNLSEAMLLAIYCVFCVLENAAKGLLLGLFYVAARKPQFETVDFPYETDGKVDFMPSFNPLSFHLKSFSDANLIRCIWSNSRSFTSFYITDARKALAFVVCMTFTYRKK